GGDTLVYILDNRGQTLQASRNVFFPDLPSDSGVQAALNGASDARGATIDGVPVRVVSLPIRLDDRLVGVVQVVRGTQQVSNQLRLIAWASVATVGLGILIAVPAGLFLARRAMRPIGEAFARQRSFVADASHELRTPLAVIRANTELAQRLLPTKSEVRDELQSVIGEVDQMSRLVDDLLFLARADAGNVRPGRERLDLAALVRAATEPMRGLAERAGLELTVEAPGALPIAGDPDQLRRVVRILVDNAIRYTPAGGRIAVRAGAAEGRTTVRVRDTGVGIAADDQPRVFERFFRSDAARSRATGGVGLGLPIARTIIHEAGGRIGLTSEPGRGSEFWFTLPLAATPTSAAALAGQANFEPAAEPHARHSVASADGNHADLAPASARDGVTP
ncbi:MAG TPA: ATP-binding protein, partial [Thermomicrobiales bacterium]|nr:ATP-binding protein [Thermomicrobiales bacterium]